MSEGNNLNIAADGKPYRWKKGQSGNPSGRPKSKTLSDAYKNKLGSGQVPHALESVCNSLVLKLDRLSRSPFSSVGNLACGLHIAADGVPYLCFGDDLSPRSPFRIVARAP